MPSPRIVAALLAAALAWFPAAGGLAQGSDDAAARALFEQGLEFVDQERFEEAADRFRRAWALRPVAGIGFNFASALVRVGGLVEASEILTRLVQDEETPESILAVAEPLLEEVRPRLGRLTVRVEGGGDSLTVQLDGSELASALVGVPFPVDPGERVVTVWRGGEEVASERVDLAEGGDETVTLRPAPAPLPPTPGPRLDDDDGGSVFGTWWLWTGLALLVAGGAVAAYFLLTADEDDGGFAGNTMPGVIVWP